MIAPDDKDWTWVLRRPCPECAFDAGACPPERVADLVRANAGTWKELHAGGRIRPLRPDDHTWSPLEYACHVRDVLQRYDTRIGLMLVEDDPMYANWDQDATAAEDRYGDQDPAIVTQDLVAAADELSAHLDGVGGPAWDRPGRRSDGASFTVATIAVYMIHDLVHHVWDVTGTPAG